MKTIKNGLVAAALALSGCAGSTQRIQTFTDLVRNPRPSEYASMQIPTANGRLNAELYLAAEGYTIDFNGNPFFIHTERNGNALFYNVPRVSYHDYDCNGHVDLMAANGNVFEINSENVDEEYRNVLSEIKQERVQRVWKYRWR